MLLFSGYFILSGLSCSQNTYEFDLEDAEEVTHTTIASNPSSEPSEPTPEPESEEEIEWENNSEPPPEGSCHTNSVQVHAEDQIYQIPNFFWEMTEDANGPKVFMVGYNSGEVDVCADLEAASVRDYAQINITISPKLDQMPQQIGIGIPGYSENVAGIVVFAPQDDTFYWGLHGNAVLNSFIENEKALVSGVFIGQMGLDTTDGNRSAFDNVDVQIIHADEIVACYCPGLWYYYKILPR